MFVKILIGGLLFFTACQSPAVEKNKELCEKTGGVWEINPGECKCEKLVFRDGEGCGKLELTDLVDAQEQYENVGRDAYAQDFLTKYCKEFENTGEWYCDNLDKYPGGVEGFREKCESIGYAYEYNAKAYFADKMGVCVEI